MFFCFLLLRFVFLSAHNSFQYYSVSLLCNNLLSRFDHFISLVRFFVPFVICFAKNSRNSESLFHVSSPGILAALFMISPSLLKKVFVVIFRYFAQILLVPGYSPLAVMKKNILSFSTYSLRNVSLLFYI